MTMAAGGNPHGPGRRSGNQGYKILAGCRMGRRAGRLPGERTRPRGPPGPVAIIRSDMSTQPAPKPIPDTYRRVTPCLVIQGAAKALEFYTAVFGATERM